MAVGAASALVAVGLAGGPLYVSSAASEAVQVGLDNTCIADAGLVYTLPGNADPEIEARLDDLAGDVRFAQSPIHTTYGQFAYTLVGGRDELTDNVVMLSRTDDLAQVGFVDQPLGDDTVLVPERGEALAGVTAGSEMRVDRPPAAGRPDLFGILGRPGVAGVEYQPDGSLTVRHDDGSTTVVDAGMQSETLPPLQLTVAGRYADLAYRPETDYWCTLRDLIRPNNMGDLPPMIVIADPIVMRELPRQSLTRVWELRPDAKGLTRHEARLLIDDLAALPVRYEERYPDPAASADSTVRSGSRRPPGADIPETTLERIVRQAEAVSQTVSRTMAPIRFGGLAAGVLLLAGAGVMLARERRSALRLRLLRGDSPITLGCIEAGREAFAIVAGTAVGVGLAFTAVRLLGPTPELEPAPTRTAVLAAVAGCVGAMVVVGAVVGFAASRTVDRSPSRLRRLVPWEAVLAVLAVLSYRHLDQAGGVRLVGDDVRGGDLLAQGFPLLALAAPLALVARPLTWLARSSRRVGARLPTPILVGLRRVGAEPAASAMVVLATGLAFGSFVVSRSMTDSAEQLLADKADTFLGADEIVIVTEVLPLPADLVGTVVGRIGGRSDGLTVDIIGVDADSLERTVRWRDDAADTTLARLLAPLARPVGNDPSDPIPAIVAGGTLGSLSVRTINRDDLQIEQTGTARWFPGLHAGATTIIVPIDALIARGVSLAEEVWLRDPPADARQQLAEAGFRARESRRAPDVFDVISFRSVRWSYSALGAFGALTGVVVVFAQLLVLDARRRARQTAWVLSRPMGARIRHEVVAVVTELAVPFTVGASLGLAAALGVLAIAVPRLDTLRQLQPPARVVFDLQSLAVATGVGVGALLVLTVIGVVGTRRGRPIELMRGGG